MTAVRARFTVFRNAAFAVATLSQLQGTVSGPTTLLTAEAPAVETAKPRAAVISRYQAKPAPVELLTWTSSL